MRTSIIGCLFVIASHAAFAGGLRGEPDTSKLCKTGQPDLAALQTCTGDCAKLAAQVCAGPDASKSSSPNAEGSVVASTSWQGAVISAIGQFTADRAKAEVATWFEDLVRDKLCALKTGDAQWFPHTCKLIADDMGTGQQLASPLLIEALEQDVPSFLTGFTSYIEANVPHGKQIVAVVTAIPVIYAIVQRLASGESPLVLLREAASNPTILDACRKRKNIDDLPPACLVVFAGTTIDYFGPIVKNVKTLSLDDVKKLAIVLFAEGEYRCTVIKAFAGTADCANDSKVPATLRPLLSATVFTTPDKVDALFAVVKDAAEINKYLVGQFDVHKPADQIRQEIAHVLDLLDPLWTDAQKLGGCTDCKPFTGFSTIGAALVKKDYRATILALITAAKDTGVKLPDWADKLLPFVTDVLEAKDAGDVSAALSRAAAPVGSWKLKRQKFLVSVSALVGGGIGWEQPFRSTLGTQSLSGGVSAGLMAPIGLQLSWPCLKSSAVGVLFSVLDVGQVTWTRLEEQSPSATDAGNKALPDATFSQVFSPGAYLVFGAGRTPFTIGAGWSVAPDLRAYTYDVGGMAVDRSVTVWRVGIFAAVDVTVFPF